MSAIASSTVSTVPSATAFLEFFERHARNVTPALTARRGHFGWRPDLLLEIGLAHLAGEVLAGGGHPADPGQRITTPTVSGA